MESLLDLEFFICCSISKRFYLLRKAFDLLYKMWYILWVVALLGSCDVTNNSHHLGFYQELEIRFKPREMMICLCLTWKITLRKLRKILWGRGGCHHPPPVRLRVKTM